jgi:adhesin HecA-like repeat protein
MSQNTPSVHAAASPIYKRSPIEQAASNQDLEERQALSRAGMISSNHDLSIIHATDTSPVNNRSPTEQAATNQDLEERQVPSRAGMISSNHDLGIFGGIFYNVHGDVHNQSGS